jgi:hypothetical protein
MPRTLSDEEFSWLQNKRQVADFVESIWADPALNKEAKRLVKRKYPQMQIPDLDIEDKVEARLEQERQARQAKEDSERQQKENAAWQNQRGATQKRYGLTDEAMGDMEKWMVEKNVGDYDVAASYRVQKDPKVSEAAFDTARWSYEKQPSFSEIAKDPEGWGRTEILKAIRTDQDRERNAGF